VIVELGMLYTITLDLTLGYSVDPHRVARFSMLW